MYYQYYARNKLGDSITGKMDFQSKEALANYLIDQGLFPIKITKMNQLIFTDFFLQKKSRLSVEHIAILCDQLATLIKGGTPLYKALIWVESSLDHLLLKSILKKVIFQIENGLTFYQAISQHPNQFPLVMRNMILIGEQTGNLHSVLKSISNIILSQKILKNKLIESLRYPCILLFTIFISSIVLNIWVFPQFNQIFSSMNVNLPFLTQVILKSSSFIKNNFVYILSGILFVFLFFLKFYSAKDGKKKIDACIFKIPLIGIILKKMMLARFAQVLSLLLFAKIPLLNAFSLVAHSIENTYITEKILKMKEQIESGISLIDALKSTSLFPPLMLQMIASGAEAGEMNHALDQIYHFYTNEINFEIYRLSSILNPLLLMIMAGFVLVFSLGVFLPLWDMGTIAFNNHS